MQVFTHGQGEVVGGLVGVNNVNPVFQSFLGCFGIVEREVHVVCEVAEDIFQMCLKGISHTDLRNGSQLCLQFCRHIGHQFQFVFHLILGLVGRTVRQIIINDGASRHQP